MQATIAPSVEAALRSGPLSTEYDIGRRRDELAGDAAKAAMAVAAGSTGKMKLNAKAFFAGLALFLFLLGITILLDSQNVVHDPKVYSGMATLVLGTLLGLLTGDAAGTGSSAWLLAASEIFLIGSLAIWSQQPRDAARRDIDLVSLLIHAASMMLSRHQEHEARRQAEQALRQRDRRGYVRGAHLYPAAALPRADPDLSRGQRYNLRVAASIEESATS